MKAALQQVTAQQAGDAAKKATLDEDAMAGGGESVCEEVAREVFATYRHEFRTHLYFYVDK